MSNSVQPQRQQLTRLPHPWDSPGKNTGVGCHFLLQCRKVKSESEVTQSCPTPSDPMDCSPPGSSIHPWDFPGKSTGVGCHCLLHICVCVYIYTYIYPQELFLGLLLSQYPSFSNNIMSCSGLRTPVSSLCMYNGVARRSGPGNTACCMSNELQELGAIREPGLCLNFLDC